MAPVESSFMKTINSFIHERGCAAAGHLFIVCLLNVCLYEAAGGPQKDQLNLKNSCPKLLLSSMSNNEMVSHVAMLLNLKMSWSGFLVVVVFSPN